MLKIIVKNYNESINNNELKKNLNKDLVLKYTTFYQL